MLLLLPLAAAETMGPGPSRPPTVSDPTEDSEPAPNEPRARHPLAFRVGIDFFSGLLKLGPSDGVLSLTAAWSVVPTFSMEATLGWGLGPASTGVHTQLLGRYSTLLRDTHRGALTFGGGGGVFAGSDYGLVAHLVSEFGFDLRTDRGFSFAVGGGPMLFLNDSDTVSRSCGMICLSDDHFTAFTPGVHVRVGAGWAI